MAKSRIKWANRRLAKADELSEDNKPKTASRMARMAKGNLRKAQEYLDAALALRDGTGGPSSQLIVKAIAKAKKNADNQTTWPNKSEHAAKSGETDPKVTDKAVTIIPPVDQLAAAKALEDATDKIGKALAGMGTLTATVGDLMNSLGAASRNGSSLPPVFALAKAGVEDVASLDKRITDLVSSKAITLDDLDNSREVIKLIRNPTIPRDFVSQKMTRLPQPVRDILTQAA
jgi:flagellin-like hook-associated protein FlgL